MNSFQSCEWADIEALRAKVQTPCASLEEAAQSFATILATSSPTAVLARVFVVLPMSSLSPADQEFATALVANNAALGEQTPVLCMLGTAGREAAWRDRARSVGHRAIPLLGARFVENIPMIAKLLADLDVGFSGLDEGKILDTRTLTGSKNGAFYVEEAGRTEDARGQRVIPNREFVDAYGVRTVFGMGGAYFDGALTVAIVFTSEHIERLAASRFPSLIGNFKISTGALMRERRIYQQNELRARDRALGSRPCRPCGSVRGRGT